MRGPAGRMPVQKVLAKAPEIINKSQACASRDPAFSLTRLEAAFGLKVGSRINRR